jgi:hypothetical protein
MTNVIWKMENERLLRLKFFPPALTLFYFLPSYQFRLRYASRSRKIERPLTPFGASGLS